MHKDHFLTVEAWLESLPPSVPLSPCKDSTLKGIVSSLLGASGNQLSNLRVAAIWLRIGEIDRSHAIVQDDSSSVASYMHGVVHRIEGDYWNANYWFQRVIDRHLLDSVQASVKEHRHEIDDAVNAPFTPGEFTKRCEVVVRNGKKDGLLALESLAYSEWLGVWSYLISTR
jgi:hypothetical protein